MNKTLYVDIKKRLKGFTLNVKFDAGPDALALLGASGSGKSMTLRCIAGLDKPDEGKIILNGRVLFDSEKGINIPSRKRKIGFLFQNYALFPNMTVEENIGFALEKMKKELKDTIVQEKIKMVKLQGLEKRFPFQLSGGQQQRVALARALAIEPEALLLDEPFSALDDHLRSHMVKQLMDTLADYKGAALFVTHNMEEAYRICKDLVVLQEGNVEARGDTKEIFRIPPTMAAAQLTRCKNFSEAIFIQKNMLEAREWGVKLNSGRTVTKDIRYVGMRANFIKVASSGELENVFPCWPASVSETPFRMTVFLSVGKPPAYPDDYQLQWELSKEKWQDVQNRPLPWDIVLDPERLIVLYK